MPTREEELLLGAPTVLHNFGANCPSLAGAAELKRIHRGAIENFCTSWYHRLEPCGAIKNVHYLG